MNSGKITLGGEDVSKIDPETLLKNYSIVFQDVTLFNNSVMENIRIGKSGATDEEVLETARLANCEEFVSLLPEKYDTYIGENGSELSGGERQRISIARAFLKDAPIILLDEATASLDAENETAIYAYRGERPIFYIPQMDIPVGEINAIVGANGAGKSTFLRCLCGMEKSCKATLKVGSEIWKNKKRRQSIYMVMQDVNHQLFTDSVLEEVMISQDKPDKEEALKILESLDLLEYADKHPLALSGGQKQRVAVASAVASGRKIIVFDEPTSGLDYKHMLQVADLLKNLKQKGITILIVTHDIELIKNACTNIIKFNLIK